MTTDIFCFYLQNRLIQTCQTGGQQYSDTPPFSIPWNASVDVCVNTYLDVCVNTYLDVCGNAYLDVQ